MALYLFGKRLQGIMVVAFMKSKPARRQKSPLKGRRGGITCCIPACFNYSRRNAAFSDISSKEHASRVWIEHIKRENFILTSHRVCSVYFEGEKKSYENVHVATVFANCAFE